MDRFVKRPETVRAYQYRQGDVEATRLPRWLLGRKDFRWSWPWANDCGVRKSSYVCINGGGCPEDGDWVVEDVFGKLSKLTDEEFRKLYRPAEQENVE